MFKAGVASTSLLAKLGFPDASVRGTDLGVRFVQFCNLSVVRLPGLIQSE